MSGECEFNAGSHVNRIPGVTLEDAGFIHTAYGSYHPVTGEGLPIDAPGELMRQIPIALIDDGIDSGIAEDFDWKRSSRIGQQGRKEVRRARVKHSIG